jgi:hypothetical protein
VNFSQFEFVQFANACPCPDEDCNCEPTPRDDDDDYLGDFNCTRCYPDDDGDYDGYFPFGWRMEFTLADVLDWAVNHMKTCTKNLEVDACTP